MWTLRYLLLTGQNAAINANDGGDGGLHDTRRVRAPIFDEASARLPQVRLK